MRPAGTLCPTVLAAGLSAFGEGFGARSSGSVMWVGFRARLVHNPSSTAG